MGKAIIIYVLGTLSIFLILNNNVNEKITSTTDTVSVNYSSIHVRNIANSTAEMLLAQLGDNKNYRVSNWTSMNIFNGTVNFRIADTLVSSDTLIKISIRAQYFSEIKNIDVLGKVAVVGSPGFIPAAVKAAISTNNNVETAGNLIVDGRNHDINGNIISGEGTFAIWTTGSFTRSGNSELGSTNESGTDYSPAKVENENVRAEGATYPGGYPSTPDLVMGGSANGFPEGKLKSIAQSGWDGSQYVTSPSQLTYPLKGVTYIELPIGTDWSPANFDGSGILVIHNANSSAKIGNINWGTFKGLLIGDDIVHLHSTIIGAIISITPNPSEGNCIGNGNGNVLYSKAAINQSTTNLKSTETIEFGFGRKRLQVVQWFE